MKKIGLNNIKSGLNKIYRFGFFIPLTNVIINYGRSILPNNLLSKLSIYRDKVIENKILGIIGDIDLEKNTGKISKSDKIWVLWLQGEDNMPPIPRMCVESIRKHSNGHEVVLLTYNNIDEYYQLPDRIKFLYEKGNITAAHLSDIIRVGLLATHGGFWIDSTMFLSEDIPGDIFNSDFFSIKNAEEGLYVSRCRWAGFCLFMKGNTLLPYILNEMLQKYWEKQDWLIDYFMLDYLIDIAANKYPAINELIEKCHLNNPNLHKLAPILCEDYNEEVYSKLISDTRMFKLSWKQFSTQQLQSNPNSFYTKLMEKTYGSKII